jgi:hypothetical protein
MQIALRLKYSRLDVGGEVNAIHTREMSVLTVVTLNIIVC